MTPTTVSVIVLTYNQSDVLKLIIQALNEQTYTGEIEVIVSDDGSPEPTASTNMAISKGSKHFASYVSHQHIGYRASAARNNGIHLAKNELLIFLDGDIIPFPDLVEKHVNQHKVSNRVVAGTRIWLGEKSDIHKIKDLQHVVPDPIAISRENRERIARQNMLNSRSPWRACFSSNLSLRRQSFVYFDERFVGWGPDDAEFCYRMCIKHGHTPIYDETIRSYHLESHHAVGNVFRTNNHADIVNYIRNVFHFYDSCAGLTLEEVFYGFPRLRLNRDNDTWSVIPGSQSETVPLENIVTTARNWITSR